MVYWLNKITHGIEEAVHNPIIRMLHRAWWGEVRDAGASLPALESFLPDRFALLIDNLLLLQVEGDDFRYHHVGSEIRRHLGLDLSGKRLREIDASGSPLVLAKYQELLAARRPVYTVHVSLLGSSVHTWERLNLPLTDAAGNEWMLAFCLPFEMREHLLEAVVDATQDGILAVRGQSRDGSTHDWIVAMANTTMEEIFGIRGHDLAGQRAATVLPAWHHLDLDALCHSVAKDHQSREREVALPDAVGCTRVYGVHVCPLIDGCLLRFADLTNAKQQEAALRESERRLQQANLELSRLAELQRQKRQLAEQANKEKSRFLAAASHDLRQPVHALSLYLGTLAGTDLPPPAQALLGNARQCAQAMDEMFRALLDVSRLDAAALEIHVEVFELSVLLDRIRVQFEPQARLKGLKFKVHPCRACVVTDPKIVERMLHNFVANALRYTERGGVLVGCRRLAGGQLRLAVYDTGPGIAPDQHEAIFDEFYQVDVPQCEHSQGLGLGLSIVRRLAMLLDVPVVLRSRPGAGSMFAIDLLLAPHTIRGRTGADGPTDVGAGEAAAGALKEALVVVVDDDAPIRAAMSTLLRQWGCDVVAAADAAELQAQLGCCRRVPSLLICDYRLGGGRTGIDVVHSLRTEFNHDIPALLVTGDTAPERLREIVRGGLPVMHKPLAIDELKQAIQDLLVPTGPAIA